MNESSVLTSTTLRYEEAFGSAGAPSWTGNISSWSWTQAGQGERSYVFGYDGLGRLTTTSQYLGSSLENKYGEDLVYDRNGNITSLVRRNGSSTGQSFSYSYSGNQRSAWEYDSNGNVTCTDVDADYPIYVSYNILNLPASVSHWDILSSEVLYLSDGTKIAVECDSGAGYHYYGPYRIQDADGSIEEVSVPGGRAVFSWRNGYMVRYTTADHLGSTRLVTDESGAVKEQYDYLPYGEKCINAGLSVAKLHKNNYLYTGKELQQYFDIDWYDSFARFQTTSGVFTSPDPLAEKYYSLSPYAYCAGDPVNLVDPEGKAVKPLSEDALEMIRNTLSSRDREFVRLNSNGLLDVKYLSDHKSDSSNYNSLVRLAESSTIIEVSLDDSFEYKDLNDKIGTHFMSYLGIDDYFVGNNDYRGIGTTTGEVGFLGKTLFPGYNASENSTDETIRVIVNSKLSKQGKAETFAHEGYGHAYMYVKTSGNYTASAHAFSKGNIDTNGLLFIQINRAINETAFYFNN